MRFFALILALLLFCCSCSADKKTAETTAQPSVTVENNDSLTPPTLIAHAGGDIYGLRYTNSKEALDSSYRDGHRFFEVDFVFTSDGYPVLLHDWESMGRRMFKSEGIKTREEFLSAQTLSDLSVMDAELLREWMISHEDAYIVTDAKEERIKLHEKLAEILGELKNRLIPQVHSEEEADALRRLGYERLIFTSYGSDKSHSEIRAFAAKYSVWAVTVTKDMLSEEELVNYRNSNIFVYTHTVNDLWEFEQWMDDGLSGIYTDYFMPNGFPYK